MSVQTLNQLSELHFARECDFKSKCTERNFSFWEWCTLPHSKHQQDFVKFTSLGSEEAPVSFVRIITLADKQPLRPAVKRSEPNFQLQPLRHHCYSHHLKKNNNNKIQFILNNQQLTELDGLLLYEFRFPRRDFVTCDYHALVFKNRKLTGGKCRCPENPT